MSERNRIVDLNGKPLPESSKPNLPEMVEAARLLYDGSEKRKAFHTLCDAMLILSQGVARNMHDASLLVSEVQKLNQRITPK